MSNVLTIVDNDWSDLQYVFIDSFGKMRYNDETYGEQFDFDISELLNSYLDIAEGINNRIRMVSRDANEWLSKALVRDHHVCPAGGCEDAHEVYEEIIVEVDRIGFMFRISYDLFCNREEHYYLSIVDSDEEIDVELEFARNGLQVNIQPVDKSRKYIKLSNKNYDELFQDDK